MGDEKSQSGSSRTFLEGADLFDEPVEVLGPPPPAQARRVSFARFPPARATTLPTPSRQRPGRPAVGNLDQSPNGVLNHTAGLDVDAIIKAYEKGKGASDPLANQDSGRILDHPDRQIKPSPPRIARAAGRTLSGDDTGATRNPDRRATVRSETSPPPPPPPRFVPTGEFRNGAEVFHEVHVRPHRRSRRRAGSLSDCSSSDPGSEDELEGIQFYDFALPARYGGDDTPKISQTEKTVHFAEASGRITALGTKVFKIVQSNWSTAAGSLFSAEIEGMIEATVSSGLHWIHIETHANNFSDFKQAVRSLPMISGDDSECAATFVDEVRNEHERRRQSGSELKPNAFSRATNKSKSGMILHFAACESLEARELRSGPRLLPRQHTARPLLETLTHRSDFAREQKQALNMINEDRGRCLYVSPTWALVVGTDCIITSSSKPLSTMLPKRSKLNIISTNTTNGDARLGRIRITYSGRSWELSEAEHLPWPSLWASILRAFDERAWGLALLHGTTELDSALWLKLLKQDRDGPLELRLEKNKKHRSPSLLQSLGRDIVGVSNISQSRRQSDVSSSDDTASRDTSTLHASPLLQLFKHSKLASTSCDILQVAKDLHAVLDGDDHPLLRSTYRKCGNGSLHDVDGRMEELRKLGPQGVSVSREMLRFIVYAKHLYSFFWPWDFEHEMLSRFWAMLQSLMTLEQKGVNDLTYEGNVRNACSDLRRAARTAIWITLTFKDDLIALPLLSQEFTKAWLHLQRGIMLLSKQERNLAEYVTTSDAARVHIEKFADLMEAADEKCVQHLRTVDIKEFERCDATGIFALILSQHIVDDVEEGTDVPSVYQQYLAKLEPEVADKPKDRTRQESLRHYLEEVNFLKDVVQLQRSVVRDTSDPFTGMTVFKNGPPRPQIGGTDRRLAIYDDAAAKCNARLNLLDELSEIGENLREQQQRDVNAMKDQQETAIYIFTVVTVVFLPLSFVSSLFGMNTNDIRNLDASQWIFWAVAIPLTLLVVGGCLWYVDAMRFRFRRADPEPNMEPAYPGYDYPPPAYHEHTATEHRIRTTSKPQRAPAHYADDDYDYYGRSQHIRRPPPVHSIRRRPSAYYEEGYYP